MSTIDLFKKMAFSICLRWGLTGLMTALESIGLIVDYVQAFVEKGYDMVR